MQEFIKAIYEDDDINKIVVDHHLKTKGKPPEGYQWVAKKTRAGVIVEAEKTSA